ncbi:MAG: restriction endonuclease subunit S [Coprococcus eutactus]
MTLFCYYNKYHSKNRIHNLHYEKFQDGTVKCIEDEIPFEVPEGWEWVRLVSICLKVTDGTHHSPDNFPTGEYKYITAKNIKLNGIVLDDITYVTAEVHKEIFARCNPEFGDILYIKDGATSGIATVNTLHEEFSMLSSVALLKPSIGIDNWYMCYAMQSPYFYNTTRGDMKGVGITRITLNMLTSRLIPIPPQNEQRQISANTSKLIELIVSIEKSKDDVLELIATTKSKILDLAIRGKLVPQDSNDEPASILLERIRAEKEELIKQGKIKRDKKKSVIFKGDDNSYYQQTGDLIESISTWELEELPDNWVLCCLGELCDYGNCNNVDADSIAGNAWILDLEDIEKNTGKVLRKIRKNERDFTSTKHSFYKGQVLYSKLRPYLNKVIIADEDGFCTSEILPLEFANVVLPQYALYYLMSPTFLRYAKQCSYGVKMPRLGTADGRKAIFPLPPIKEQYRIANSISKCFTQIDNILSALL